MIAALCDACREHPTVEKWVMLTSLAQGQALGERLAREGNPWINLRFTTPAELARDLASVEMARSGLSPLHAAAGSALTASLLEGDLGNAPRYFRRLAGAPGLARALFQALTELRMAGLEDKDLAKAHFVSAVKGSELQALMKAFEKALTTLHLADTARTFRIAMEGKPGRRLLFADASVRWRVMERRLMEQVAGEVRFLPFPTPAGLPLPRRLEAAKPWGRIPAHRLAWLYAPKESPATPHVREDIVEMFHAAGHAAEIQEVLRRVLAEGLRFDEVEVVLASDQPYSSLVRDLTERIDIPATYSDGISAVHTRPGRALAAFCRWASEGFPADSLVRLLQSGDLDTLGDRMPPPGEAARLLLAAHAAGGRGAATEALRRLALREETRGRQARQDGDEEEAIRRQRSASKMERLAEWAAGLEILAPEGQPEPGKLFRGCREFMKQHLSEEATALDGALTALAALTLPRAPLSVSLAQVLELVEEIRVRRAGPRPGHLHITSLDAAGWAGRRRTFVLGLDQGALPGIPREDPVLLDDELAGLQESLASSSDRVREAVFLGAGRLGAMGGKITLSYAARDLREDRELYPASILLQAHRLEKPKEESLAFADLLARLGAPVTRLPTSAVEALDDTGWWLASLRGVGERREAVLAAFPSLASGEKAAGHRADSVFGPFDGLIPEAGKAADPRRSGKPVSASALEQFSRCAFQFYLQRLLRLPEPPDQEEDSFRWLDPLTRGSLLHGLYERFLRDPPLRNAERLKQMGLEALQELKRRLPPPSPRLEALETEALMQDLADFARLEEAQTGRTPVGLELPFGPLTLDLGGVLLPLKGQIDRIDRLGDGPEHEVVDYKTGRAWSLARRRARLEGGAQLQHALYARAAEVQLGISVSHSSYYFPTARGNFLRLSRPRIPDEELGRLLGRVLDAASAGTFLQTGDAGTCGRCAFRKACGEEPWRIGKAKREAADEVLKPLLMAEAQP